MGRTKKTADIIEKITFLRMSGRTWSYISKETGISVVSIKRWLPDRVRDYRGKRTKNRAFEGLSRRDFVKTDRGKIWLSLQSSKKHCRMYGWAECFATVDEILNLWDGSCKICNKIISLNSRDRAIDHCHVTGEFRGWLCRKCNVGLGCFDDSIERLESAAKYLSNRQR